MSIQLYWQSEADYLPAMTVKKLRRFAELATFTNTAFLRTPIERIDEFFSIGEVAEMWIPFPDPFPRRGKAKKRLTSPRFLNLYRNVLKSGGVIHLKTDDENLFNYTME